MLHVMVFTCMQFYNLPHIETTTGNYGSKTAVCAGTALKNILNSNLIYLRKRSRQFTFSVSCLNMSKNSTHTDIIQNLSEDFSGLLYTIDKCVKLT